MTTKVKIEIAQEHIPVWVDVVRSDGSVQSTAILKRLGEVVEEYVHFGRSLRVREMTTEEMHADRT